MWTWNGVNQSEDLGFAAGCSVVQRLAGGTMGSSGEGMRLVQILIKIQ